MPILAEQFVHVIGVDTHKLRLTAAALNASGGCLELLEVGADARGYGRLLELGSRFSGPLLWAVEGTGSYGAALTEHLLANGQTVTEVDRPKRPPRRRGKSDEIDAIRAGRDALAMKRLNPPRRRQEREQLRILFTTRQELVSNRTRLANHLMQLVVTASEKLRSRFLDFGSHGAERLVRQCLASRCHPGMSAEDRTRLTTMRELAHMIRSLSADADRYEQEIAVRVEQMAPGLCAQPGVGALDRGADSALLVARRPNAKRGYLCRPGRRLPDPRLLGSNGSSSPQPRWRPPAQRRPPPGRSHSLSLPPVDP